MYALILYGPHTPGQRPGTALARLTKSPRGEFRATIVDANGSAKYKGDRRCSEGDIFYRWDALPSPSEVRAIKRQVVKPMGLSGEVLVEPAHG